MMIYANSSFPHLSLEFSNNLVRMGFWTRTNKTGFRLTHVYLILQPHLLQFFLSDTALNRGNPYFCIGNLSLSWPWRVSELVDLALVSRWFCLLCCGVLCIWKIWRHIKHWQYQARAHPTKQNCKKWRCHNWRKNCERRGKKCLGGRLNWLNDCCNKCNWRREAQEVKNATSQKQGTPQAIVLMSLSRWTRPFRNLKSCWKKRGWSSFGRV